MPLRQVAIQKNDAGQRVDKFLTKAFPNLPQAMLYKCIRKKDIKVNGKRCEISTRLREGDVVSLYMKEEFFQKEEREEDFLKAPAKLNVLYEDENVMLLDKRPGLIVHPDENYHFDSLIARVQHYLYDKGEYDPQAENAFAPALANRIDRNTGGIVLAAKNAEALRVLNQKIKDRELRKLYLCVVCGRLAQKEGLLSGYLEKNESQNRGVHLPKAPAGGQEHPHQVPGLGGAGGTSPWWRWSSSPGAPTRSGPTSPPSATLWPGTGSTGKTRSTRRPAFPTRPFTPTSWPLISGPMEGFSPIWTAGSSPCRTCGFLEEFRQMPCGPEKLPL